MEKVNFNKNSFETLKKTGIYSNKYDAASSKNALNIIEDYDVFNDAKITEKDGVYTLSDEEGVLGYIDEKTYKSLTKKEEKIDNKDTSNIKEKSKVSEEKSKVSKEKNKVVDKKVKSYTITGDAEIEGLWAQYDGYGTEERYEKAKENLKIASLGFLGELVAVGAFNFGGAIISKIVMNLGKSGVTEAPEVVTAAKETSEVASNLEKVIETTEKTASEIQSLGGRIGGLGKKLVKCEENLSRARNQVKAEKLLEEHEKIVEAIKKFGIEVDLSKYEQYLNKWVRLSK